MTDVMGRVTRRGAMGLLGTLGHRGHRDSGRSRRQERGWDRERRGGRRARA